jgi:hypothetical protein
MSASPLLPWRWLERSPALEPQAAVAWGDVAVRLHARLSDMSREQQGRVSATANRDVLVMTGAMNDLPWVDGIEYAAPSPEAPQLWLPTHSRPNVPCDLLAQGFCRNQGRQPLLIWPNRSALLPLDRLLPVSSSLLACIDTFWQTGWRPDSPHRFRMTA